MWRIIKKIFGSAWLLWLLITTVFAVLIYLFGDLLAFGSWRPFGTQLAKYITIGVLYFIVILMLIIRTIRRRRRERRMDEDIVAEEEDGDDVVEEELLEMRKRMKEALQILKKSKLGGKGGRRNLYQLPWYIMIGPPGAGKTTAIVNSGLNFPLAEKMGMQALGGIGGTRNCDWWFTDEAVLIDTAGRYTTQDSDAEADRDAWLGFLAMLKRNRKRQPINGAMVAISLSDISMLDTAARKEHANAIRQRLVELREKLGVRFPVYILFTKADLIAGFSEFYENLGREEREQVWGFTYPIKGPKTKINALAEFDGQFTALLGQLNNLTLERLQQETDSQRRGLINGFAQQLASLQTVAKEFLTDVFQENKYQDQQFLRGVYFTSGTQEGTPIDRLMMNMARTFGIGRQAIGTGSGQGRSYFLRNLIETVIFGEAGLVSADDKVERRYRWIKRGAITAAILFAAGVGTLWTFSFLGNKEMIAQASADVDRYNQMVSVIPVSPVDEVDLLPLIEPLNILRDLPGNPAQDDPEPPRELTWGLWQGDNVGNAASQTYRRALNERFLPRILLKLERQMQANLNNPELLYELLKVYMMLGLQGPIDEQLVVDLLSVDWDMTYPGEQMAQAREDLVGHLTQMINQPMQEISLHGPLVAQVQALLSETPVSVRVYNSIIASPEARAINDWRVLEQGGPLAARVLIRPSGLPLSEGVEGIYTRAGFYNVFLPAALDVAEQLRAENWVLGERGEDLSDEEALTRIASEVLDLYYTDYIANYERILGDVDIAPMGAMSEVVQTLDIISGPNSPVAKLMTAVAYQTQLTAPPGAVDIAGAASDVTEFGAQTALDNLSIRTRMLVDVLASSATANGQPAPPPPGTTVEERFRWLRDFTVGEEGVPTELSDTMARLTALYQELNRLSVTGGSTNINSTATQDLQVALGRIPDPMKRWATQITEASSGVAAGGARAALNAQWQAQVLPTCNRAITDRFPFFRGQSADVPIQEFARLFAPQGLIDGFFQANLAEFVDTTSSPWKWRRVNNQELGISDSVLSQFQRAAEIRDAFFLAPGLPAVTFDLKPVALDPAADRVQIVVDGQILDYRQSQPQQVTPMQWPGSGGATQVAFQPQNRNTENGVGFEGPWAFFRMLEGAEVRRGNAADRSRIIFNVGGRIAVFELRAGAAINPFDLEMLRGFRCPSSL